MKNRIPEMLLLILLLFHVINNCVWLSMNEYYYGHDEETHLDNAIRYVELYKSGLPYKISDLVFMGSDYPPLYYTISGLISLIFGLRYFSLAFTSTVFFVLAMLAVYLIGKRINNKYFGFNACLIFSFYPAIFTSSRFFALDLALTSMVCLAMYCLIASDFFQNAKYSLMSGIALGLGMLTKQYFSLFIFVPSLVTIIQGLRQSYKRKSVVRNILIAVFSAIAISAIFYNKRWIEVKLSSVLYRMCIIEGAAYEWSLSGRSPFLFYITKLLFNQISVVMFIVFLYGLYVFLRKNRKRVLILSWILTPYLVLSLVPCKFARYGMPYLPAIALITAYGIENIKIHRIISYLSLSIFLLMQFYYVSFNVEVPFAASLLQKNTAGQYPPHYDTYKLNEVASYINKEIGRKMLNIGFISEGSTNLDLQLKIKSKLKKYPYRWSFYYRSGNMKSFIRYLGRQDVIIYLRSPGNRFEWLTMEILVQGLDLYNQDAYKRETISKEEFKELIIGRKNFKLKKVIEIPSGSYCIYFNKKTGK